jgi:hypothetical protein
MNTIVDCPKCTRKLRVPEELLGRAVKCPDCGGTFEANPAPAPPSPAGNGPAAPVPAAMPPLNLSLDEDAPPSPPPLGTPFSVTPRAPEPAAGVPAPMPAAGEPKDDLRPCPYCAERIKPDAPRCPACGEDLRSEEEDRPWERPYRRPVRRDCEPHRGNMVLVFGILSLVIGFIGLGFGIAAWLMGRNDLKKMQSGAMDPEGRGLTQAGYVCGIIGTIWQGIMMLFCVAYFVFIFAMIGMTAAGRPMPVPAATMKVAPAPPVPPRQK